MRREEVSMKREVISVQEVITVTAITTTTTIITTNTTVTTIITTIVTTVTTTIDLIGECRLPRIQLDELNGVEYLTHELDASIRELDGETTQIACVCVSVSVRARDD